MGGYIMRLSAVAILCAIASALTEKDGAAGKLVKLMASVCMVIAIVQPVLGLQPHSVGAIFEGVSHQAQQAVADGEKVATERLKESIISRFQAYRLDKAEPYGADLTIEVTLSDGELPVPVALTMRGSCSPYARQRLSELIARELDIEQEAQTWIVEN